MNYTKLGPLSDIQAGTQPGQPENGNGGGGLIFLVIGIAIGIGTIYFLKHERKTTKDYTV